MSGDNYNPNSVDATLARIESRQKENSDKLDEVISRFERAEVRISEVEKKQWWLTGAGASLAFLASKLFGGK